jgi:DNA-binding NtrC family response regulator
MNDVHWQPGVTLADIEKQVILKALKWFGNNRRITAASLGIAVRTLDYKLERYNGVCSEAGARLESDQELPQE